MLVYQRVSYDTNNIHVDNKYSDNKSRQFPGFHRSRILDCWNDVHMCMLYMILYIKKSTENINTDCTWLYCNIIYIQMLHTYNYIHIT